MNLEIEEINLRFGYVSVIDRDTNKVYFAQGDEGHKCLDFIEEWGTEKFLEYLESSGFFQEV